MRYHNAHALQDRRDERVIQLGRLRLFWQHRCRQRLQASSLINCIADNMDTRQIIHGRTSLHVPQPGTSGDEAFRKVLDSGSSGPSVIGGRMGTGARAALRPLLVMPSPSSVRASLVLGWREEGANRGSGPGPTRSLFLADPLSLTPSPAAAAPLCAVPADCSRRVRRQF